MYRPNIPLSAHHASRILGLDNHTKYIPPHPQRGTPYHRYVLFLLQQPPRGSSEYTLNIEARAKPDEPTSLSLDIPVVPDEQRNGFDLRSFMHKWGFDMRTGGGVHMWREVWDKHVSTVYKDLISMFSRCLSSCRCLILSQRSRSHITAAPENPIRTLLSSRPGNMSTEGCFWAFFLYVLSSH